MKLKIRISLFILAFMACFFCIGFSVFAMNENEGGGSGGSSSSNSSNTSSSSGDTSSGNTSSSGTSSDGEESGGGILDGLLNGIKDLFLPDQNFFSDFQSKIMAAIDEKTGGMASALSDIQSKFEHFKTCNCKSSGLSIKIPDNHFYKGYKGIEADILKSGKGFFDWGKPLATGALIIFTVIICYQKLIKLFKGGE